MKKIFAFLLVVFAVLFSGCGSKNIVSFSPSKPVKLEDNNEKMKVTVSLYTSKYHMLMPFNAENAVYHLAKFAKENGYNYIYIVYPTDIKRLMPGSVEELDDCIKPHLFFGKCSTERVRKVYASGFKIAYLMSAVLYKKQPFDIVTLPVDKLIEKYKDYDLQKEGYKIIIKRK